MAESQRTPDTTTERKPDAPTEMARAAAQKLWSRVDKNGPVPTHCPELGPCWIYTAGRTKDGYGQIYLGGGRKGAVHTYAHRLVLFLQTGFWGRLAMHACDNPPCCNPSHLSWASHAENSQDARAKRIQYIGEANSNAKLNEVLVRKILDMRANGKLLREIAKESGFSVSLLSKVCRREIWAHV